MSLSSIFGTGLLTLGTSGPSVTLLHTALLRLDYAISPKEIVDTLFGKDTRTAILQFQRRWGSALPQTGTVDDATALLLLEKSAECKPKRFVYGSITFPNGLAASRLTVQVFDRDLRREERLASVHTTEIGYFSCIYLPEQLCRAEKASADLLIRVIRGSEVLYNPTLDDIIFNAPDLAIINISLSKGATAALDEYTKIVTTVHPLLEGQDIDLSSLREDDKVQDISFLVKETSLDRTKLIYVVVANKLSTKYKILPEFFYALFAEQALANSASTASPLGTRIAIGLDVNLTLLFYDIVLLPSDSVTTAVKTAVTDLLVPRSLLDILSRIQKQLTGWRPQAEEYVKKNPVEDQIFSQVRSLFEERNVDALRENLPKNYFGDFGGLIEGVYNALLPQVDAPSAVSKTSSDEEGPSATTLLQRISEIHSIEDERRMAAFSEDDFTEYLRHPSLPTAGLADLSRRSLASTLAKVMEQRFPTASFSAKIQRDDGVFGGHGKSISQILDSHPEFDLRKGNIELLFKGIKEKKVSASDNPEVKETMKALQRVFKLTPNFRQTEALFRKNVRSCAAISGMGRSRFLAAFASLPDHPFTPEEGSSVFHRAENIYIATMMLAGNIHSASSALQLKAFSNPLPPAKLEAISKDFPNLKSLFQFGDACACDDCMTVHSAAAYLVDVLLFLDQRWVIDTTKSGGDISTIGARTALFSRRPDLGDLDLNCANTNNALPYIDVVCELLEDAVAPDGGFSVPSAVPVDTGLVSPALLQLLEGQGLPFTKKATVSDQDKSTNSRVIRDSSVVVKLTPSGSGQWVGRVLKQTYQTADKLAAMPEYVNIDAYDRLRTAPYAFSLPFDLDHMETRAYFAQYSISRAQLMRVLAASGSPSAIDITVEELGLTDEDRQLIITEDPNNQDRYWNTGNPSDPVSNLVKVDAFITRASIKYSDLQTMLSLGLTKRASWLNPSNVMYIHHEDSSCDLSKKDIAKLDKTGLDRLHRFIHLWKKISAPGWDIALIDRAISISTLGGGDLGDSLLQGVADIRRLRDKIGGGISLTECVALYDHFVLDGTDAVYANVFLNVSANGPINQDFQPANVETNPLGKKVNEYVDYLSVCFGRSADDVKLLLSSLPDHGDDLLSANSLSILYQRHTLARWLNLTVEDLLSLKILTGLQDLKDPSSTLSLLDALASVRSSNLSLSDLLYFLAHRASPADLDSKDLHDEVATSILTRLQVAYIQAREDNSSPFDKNATSEENTSSATALASKLPGFKATDSGKLVLIFSNKWADTSNTASSFIDEAFGSLVDTTQIQAALAALETAPPSETESRILDLIQVIDATISTYLYNVAKQADLLSAIEDAFSVKGDVAQAILRHAQVAGAQDRTPQAILTDESLVGQPALPPPLLTPSEFDPQYRALRLLNMVFSFIQKMGLSTDEIPWILQNSRLLQWLAIDGLKYQDDIPIASFNGWIQLQTAVKLSGKLPLVIDPLNHSMPLSIYGLFSLTLVSSTTLDSALKYLSQLAGWEITSVTDLSERFGLTIGALKDPLTITRLQDAVAALRTIHLDLNSALQVIKPKLSSSETSIMRQALKSLYDDPTWLGIIKNIMDPLRLLKRDALVAFLLAVNPSMKDTDDLYDYFLIDVEMGSQMATSRIVQAHATVQLFVQRCLMGLEPSSIADQKKDASWKQWTWMSQFRLWEANRKVFLWPENWIEPELRDDKSEIFITLENTLQQNQINADTVQDATVVYLESLNDIAQLQVLATYYQLDTYIMHIFARTKGGDPPVFYYRQLLQERSWTPWQKIDVDIKGEHIVAFDRNGRLSLAWLEINLESDPNVAVKVPNPNSIPAAGLPATPPKQRWKIQLAVSERDLAGKWRPKKLSQGAVFYPPAGNYVTATTLPMDDRFHLFTLTLGDNQAMTIARDGIMFGAFSLEGCKGYPEPISYVSRVLLRFLPAFRNCEMDPQVFVKQSLTAKSDYAMASLFNLGNFETILGLTQGIFRTAYPMQMSLIDWAFVFLELYLMTRGNATRSAEFVMRSALTVPLGTFMPFFHNDFARTWAVIPNFHPGRRPSVIDDLLNGEEKTFSDIYPLVILAFTLLRRYLLIWEKDHDFNKLKELLVADPDYQKFVTEIKKLVGLQRGYHFYNLYHPLMCFLLSTVNSGGIPALMDRETQLKDTGFNFQKTYAPVFGLVSADYPTEDFEFRPIDGYASYNWELFFHLPFEIAVRLSQQQKFEEAQNWFHYVFNPLGTTESGDKPQRYWNTKPFFTRSVSEYQEQLIDQILYSISSDPNADHIDNLKDAVTLWRQNPFSPYTVARSRTVALQTTLVLHYIKNLLDWGDSLFRQFTRESVTAATQLYILADKLLGPKPRQVPPAVPTPPNTFNELESKLDIFGNALLTLENLVPDLGTLPHHGDELPSPTSGVTFSSLYFAIPQNENMLLYWDTVADRLYKIRNSQNIDGVFTPLALFAPPIDPGAIIRALASGVSLASVIQGLSAPLPLYRFWFVTQKASELTLLAASLGNALLSALEKQDAEELARLRSDQEIVVLNGLRAVKVSAIAEGEDSIKALERSLLVAQERLNYYSSRPYMNAWEIASTVLSGASLAIDVGVLLSYLLSGVLKAIPDFQAGAAGFGGSPTALLVIGGQSLGGSAETITKSVESAGKILDKSAAMTSQQASFQRRQDDWEFNATLAQLDIETINAQIDTAKTKLDGLLKDLDAHDLRIHAEQASNSFMKSKYTSKELYNWMVGQISSTYFTAYNLAYDMAKRAERSFMFELADTSGDSFIGYGYWDSLRSGLLAAETLGKDIKKLESAYMDRNKREFELAKNISLAELDPFALISLRATGQCLVQIPEEAYDLDYPGHYLRRIKTVSISIPCIVGPLVPVSATLSLTSNRYRRTTDLSSDQNPYKESPPNGDSRFVYNVGAIQSIALSTAVNDAGVFELNFRDERYLPFEGTGAIGSWRLQLPTVVRRFDYSTITDVIFHIRYTARDGGSVFRQAVEQEQLQSLNQMVLDATHSGLYQVYNLKQLFPTEWAQLLKTNSTKLTISARHLPYFARSHAPKITAVAWFVNSTGNSPQFSFSLDGQTVNLSRDTKLGNLYVGSSVSDSVALDHELVLSVDVLVVPSLIEIAALVQYEITT